MLKKKEKLIITFFTSAEAMATEKACKEAKITGSLISAPRALTSDCGISYALDIEYEDKIRALLDEKKIEYEKIVRLLV